MPKSVKIKRLKINIPKEKLRSTPGKAIASGANNVLYEEFRLIEKNEEDVSPLWKSLHLLLFFLAFIFGSFCTFCFHMLMYMFDEKCVLYPKLVSLTSSKRHKKIFEYLPFKSADGQSVAMDYLQTNWSEKSVCYLPTYLPLVSAIFGLVWITMFLMCSTGSRAHTGLQRPWRVMLPVFVFSLLMGTICFSTTLITHRGLSDFCDKLSDAIGTKTCSYTVNVVTLVYERRISGVYQATVLTIVSAWIHSLCWIFSALLVVLRVILNVDFHLVRVKAVLHGDIDVMLQRYEKQIRTVLPEERRPSPIAKTYAKSSRKMEMLYNRTSSANQESGLTQYSDLSEVGISKHMKPHEKYISDMLYKLVDLIDIEMSMRVTRKPRSLPKPTHDLSPGRSDEYLAVDLDTETLTEPIISKSVKGKEKKGKSYETAKKKKTDKKKDDTDIESAKEVKDKNNQKRSADLDTETFKVPTTSKSVKEKERKGKPSESTKKKRSDKNKEHTDLESAKVPKDKNNQKVAVDLDVEMLKEPVTSKSVKEKEKKVKSQENANKKKADKNKEDTDFASAKKAKDKNNQELAMDLDDEILKELTTSKSAKEKERTGKFTDIAKKKKTDKNKEDTDLESLNESKNKNNQDVPSNKSDNIAAKRQDKDEVSKTTELFLPKLYEDYLTDSFLRIKPRKGKIKEFDSPTLRESEIPAHVTSIPLTPSPEVATTSSAKNDYREKDKDYISDWDVVFSNDDKRKLTFKGKVRPEVPLQETQFILKAKDTNVESIEKTAQIVKKETDVEENKLQLTQKTLVKKPDESDQESIYLSVTSSELHIEKEIVGNESIINTDEASEDETLGTHKDEKASVGKDLSSKIKTDKEGLREKTKKKKRKRSSLDAAKRKPDEKSEISETGAHGVKFTPEVKRAQEIQHLPKISKTDKNLVHDEFIISPDSASMESDYAVDIPKKDSKEIKPKKKEKMD